MCVGECVGSNTAYLKSFNCVAIVASAWGGGSVLLSGAILVAFSRYGVYVCMHGDKVRH